MMSVTPWNLLFRENSWQAEGQGLIAPGDVLSEQDTIALVVRLLKDAVDQHDKKPAKSSVLLKSAKS